MCLYPSCAVGLQARESALAVGQLTFEHGHLLAHDLEQTGVLGALGAIAVNRGLELLPGFGSAPVSAADDLLQAIPEDRLVTPHAGQLRVADTGGGTEEVLTRDPGDLSHLVLYQRVVAARTVPERELTLRARTIEALDQPPRLVAGLEVERDYRRG